MAREPCWKALVRELTDSGFESIYLDRLRARVDVAQAQACLEKEIISEMAAALGRAEDKVNAALLRLEVASRELADADATCRDRLREAYDACYRDAMKARWELVIHREAVGFRRNEIVDQLYRIPPRLTAGRPATPSVRRKT